MKMADPVKINLPPKVVWSLGDHLEITLPNDSKENVRFLYYKGKVAGYICSEFEEELTITFTKAAKK